MDHPNRLVAVILELRKSLLSLGLALLAATALHLLLAPYILAFLQSHLNQELAYFTVAEPFLARLKLALALAFFTLAPLFAYWFWRALANPFKLQGATFFWFVTATCLLFYAGALFCYFITLPFGTNFLLGFQSEQLKPVIAIGKFVSFVTLFVLAFGVIFELPIFMLFSARTGLIPRKSFESNRRYAILAISIIAALLTPTPDVVNMMLMAVPLYLLYEAGIMAMKLLRIA